MEYVIPFTKNQILELMKTRQTPFHVYDERAIRENARRFKHAFRHLEGFKEYFAVKALPNPFILKILKSEGFGADCSSLPELKLASMAGIFSEDIMYTSNDTPAEEFVLAKKLGAVINLDDISHIPFLEEHAGIPNLICFRYNPGKKRKGNHIIGSPEEAKYGLTKKQLFEAYKIMKDKGTKRFGLHTMVISNELNSEYFVQTARMLFELAVEIKKELGIKLEFVNLGGGIGTPYRPEEESVNYETVADGIKKAYDEMIVGNNLSPLKIFIECGRVITGPYGYLVSSVRHIKDTYKKFVGLDACMADLMRPGMYGKSAYHHITVMGKEDQPSDYKCDVTGSLCENNDKFAVDRMLPEIVPGDILVIHNAGAHSHAMGFNYNGKLRHAELLMREDGSFVEIRRDETLDDHFRTLDLNALKTFVH